MSTRNNLKIFTFLILLILELPLHSQVTVQWSARYNGTSNSNEEPFAMAVDLGGNVFVTGYTWNTNRDYVTIKYNSSGVQQWVATYSGSGNPPNETATSIAVDGTGNVYVSGISGNDYATIKYNSSGIQQWVSIYNVVIWPQVPSMVIDNSGNAYITGMANNDYVTIKYNSSGVQQWAVTYNGPGNGLDWAQAIILDNSGNIYITGGSVGSGSLSDIATIKYNPSGIQQWVQRYNGSANSDDAAASIGIDPSGNIYVTGHSQETGNGYDCATIKYNPSGTQLWVQSYNGPSNNTDIAKSIAVDMLGNSYISGWTNFISGTGCLTIKYNTTGILQWDAIYNPGGSIISKSNALDINGNVYVTGGYDPGYLTMKYDPSGVQRWLTTYSNGISDTVCTIKADNSGNVYVTGSSMSATEGWDIYTIKYSQPDGITPLSNEIPGKYSLYQNYPNPFNPSTKIRFALPKSSFVTLTVYDVLGRKVETLINQNIKAGVYETSWDAGNYSSNIYFYKFQTEDYSETKKMIITK